MFLEVVIEPLDPSITKDPELRLLLEEINNKRKLLLEAKELFYAARTSSEYMDVINKVRAFIDGLRRVRNKPSKLENVLRKAYSTIGIAEGEGAEELIEELTTLISDVKDLFGMGSKLGAHGSTLKTKKSYVPRPNREDAEYALISAIAWYNYIVKVLSRYNSRL